jgi:peptidoglycan/LPS O-acetylase OafA/YrhL
MLPNFSEHSLVEIIWVIAVSAGGFGLALFQDRIVSRMRRGPKPERRLDAAVYGHRFVTMSIGVVLSMLGRASDGNYTVPFTTLVKGDAVTVFHIAAILLMFMWAVCILLRGNLGTENRLRTRKSVNRIGLFSYAVSLWFLLGIR